MFEQLALLPDDPILSLIGAFLQDNNPLKVDLGAGVYKDETGIAPILTTVKAAEHKYLSEQTSKTYTGIAGDMEYNHCIEQLIFGQQHPALQAQRISTIQTPGSSGGLYLAAQLIARSNPNSKLWLSQPTWDNHYAIFASANIATAAYPYYRIGQQTIDFEQMLNTLRDEAKAGDAVLLHGCCHNPSGADLSPQQWRDLTALVLEKDLVPVIDQAYQGFAHSLEEDAYGIRYMAEHLPELIVSASCSKNFTLYRERTGSISVLSSNSKQNRSIVSQLLAIARACYSIPPANGAAIVKTILMDEASRLAWQAEVETMRQRLLAMRTQLAEQLQQKQQQVDFSYLLKQHGMFSFLPLNTAQITALREQHSIYMVGSGRISFTGLTTANIDYAADAIAAVIK
ncbi:aspartate/tyrosine/aromatic aminotransferase [Dasania sp. GY-MA-18]|uniref:Aspartate/tyrosine/aromatic aminotransferase n=1 Tax=Dasania phycosphaerae TaxID=2950436 RepID=A0A9J6RN00_9GAMM|nr:MULTISPECIES: amino acid aminotransferase [Dasania]MCR8923111.1 aspartate/tyrosine/aromatic aminotransferase [Dasania sp. GY-MA-18]MCZ0865543.1 aspartate/tyrosine/aromatic aminotransferase [Dasania phycosphaerae]MCZ0869268.1 aspartate/tyrosine/aromatic aminotransferase [Dasania phycosphaerae]